MPTREPDQEPVDEMVQSEELGDAGVRVDQQNQGHRSRGGGEFPDPDTPPSGSAPGETGVTHQQHGKGQFNEAYDTVPEDVANVGSIADDDVPPEQQSGG